MKNAIEEAEKAEVWQSIKALLIPLSLFLACLAAAAGTFLVYNQEPVGWIFLGTAAVIIGAALTGLVRFQNKYRAKGMLVKESMNSDAAPTGQSNKQEAMSGITRH